MTIDGTKSEDGRLIAYVFPAHMIDDFVQFTKDFTVWDAFPDKDKGMVHIQPCDHDDDDEGGNIDEYVGRYLMLQGKAIAGYMRLSTDELEVVRSALAVYARTQVDATEKYEPGSDGRKIHLDWANKANAIWWRIEKKEFT